jgi:Flp pilus assembly protein TadG
MQPPPGVVETNLIEREGVSLSLVVSRRKTHRRSREERGAAVVEFAIASMLLVTLLFGIISYAYALSFKQGLTQAAAEGARKAAVSTAATAPANAATAVEKAVNAFNKHCNTGDGTTCTYNMTAAATGCATDNICMRVRVSYDNNNFPLMPKFPGLGILLPGTLQSTSITQVS